MPYSHTDAFIAVSSLAGTIVAGATGNVPCGYIGLVTTGAAFAKLLKPKDD